MTPSEQYIYMHGNTVDFCNENKLISELLGFLRETTQNEHKIERDEETFDFVLLKEEVKSVDYPFLNKFHEIAREKNIINLVKKFIPNAFCELREDFEKIILSTEDIGEVKFINKQMLRFIDCLLREQEALGHFLKCITEKKEINS